MFDCFNGYYRIVVLGKKLSSALVYDKSCLKMFNPLIFGLFLAITKNVSKICMKK